MTPLTFSRELLEQVPAELRARRQWVAWRSEIRKDKNGKDKKTKVPYNARTWHRASSTDSATWVSFDEALASHENAAASDGIGFVFTPNDAYTGVDLDNCFGDEGRLAAWAASILEHFPGAYVERSPSGNGLKLFVRGSWPNTQHRKAVPVGNGARVEVYDRERYFTVTGKAWGTAPREVPDAREGLVWLASTLFPEPRPGPKSSQSSTNGSTSLEDDELINKAHRASNGALFAQLWAGEWEAQYDSQSEADLALCSLLAFYTGPDPGRVDRLFRRSGLYRDKWERKDYRKETIDKALAGRTEYYSSQARARADEARTDPRSPASQPVGDGWPAPPDVEAFQGFAGDFVNALDPHTEADRAAILTQFLVAFGNALNRGPHFVVEGDVHAMNLFVVLVGATSKGRKGTSAGHVRKLFSLVDEEWERCRINSGLSSGEGLIWSVRDASETIQPIKEGKCVVGHKKVQTDPGVSDKRLLVYEPEFSSALRVMSRDGNTLSSVIREAWDGRDRLQTLTKNSPAVATDAHISIIGHITRDELRRSLTETDMANGFANRFLWVCSRRSKCLPESVPINEDVLQNFASRLSTLLVAARKVRRIDRDAGARRVWFAVYPQLSEGNPGLLGAVTSRAEAQVMRLACLYALLAGQNVIRVEDLRAALALWRFCDTSARYVFGDSVGYGIADDLLTELRWRHPAGMSRTEIRDHFKRHKSAAEIDRALETLAKAKLAFSRSVETAGRPEERWFAVAEGASHGA